MGLGFLPGGFLPSWARDVSDNGMVVVGGSFDRDSRSEAFIWTPDKGMRSLREILVKDCGLDLTSWTLSDALAISADGSTIVGWGCDAYMNRAWVATIPEPATFSLLALGGLALLHRRRGPSA